MLSIKNKISGRLLIILALGFITCQSGYSQCSITSTDPSSIRFTGMFGESEEVTMVFDGVPIDLQFQYDENYFEVDRTDAETFEVMLITEVSSVVETSIIISDFLGDPYELPVVIAPYLAGGLISATNTTVCYNTSPGTLSNSTSPSGGVCSSYTYAWQKSTSGGGSGFNTISGATSSTYTPGNLTQTTYFRRKVTCGDETAYSNVVTITVYETLSAEISGGSTSICYNDSPGTFTASAEGGSGTYTYLWYKDGVSTGVTTQTYTPGVLTTTTSFYCIVTSGPCGPLQTDGITVNVGIYGSPDKSKNYIYSIDFTREVTDTAGLHDMPIDSIRQAVTYYDGLGRLTQTNQIFASPQHNDIITPVIYDDYGREAMKYLPYSTPDYNCGMYVDDIITRQESFYNNLYPGEPAYAETVFESSPLNRVFQQGAPGTTWQPDNGHVLSYSNNVNDEYEVLLWRVRNDSCINTGTGLNNGHYYYPAGALYNSIVKDENWTSAGDPLHTTEEFKDIHGNVILKRNYVYADGATTAVETYYVYDDFGLLRYVLPPEAINNLDNQIELTQSSTLVKKWCYYYQYDGRKRMIVKQLPGADPLYLIYDPRDRLVAMQDGNMRTNLLGNPTRQWLFTKYDKLNRPVVTGLLTASINFSREEMQELADTAYLGSAERVYYVERASTAIGYDDASFPNTTDGTVKYYTALYYDDYNYADVLAFNTTANISDYSDVDGNVNYFDNTTGLATGSKVLVLDDTETTYLTTTTYYDDRYRPIQVIRNLYDGDDGVEITSNNYDFIGQVLETKIMQTFEDITTTVSKYYTYDHMGRLLTSEQQITGDSHGRVTLAANTYDELGQLVTKDLHKTTSLGPLQSIDYKYNIRGWLTAINDPDNIGSDKFAMELYYDDNSELGTLTSEAQYNGNISGVKWLTGPQALMGYGFVYDGLNRTLNSYFGRGTGLTGFRNYLNESATYDLNGNIQTLSRSGYSSSVYYSNLDVLSYDYGTAGGNRLMSVTDAGQDAYGFVDVDSTVYDYDYDLNGNMVRDLNKGITSIGYNYLNLPSEVTKDTNNIVEYIYDATGAKLLRRSTISGTTTNRYYSGLFEYEDDALDLIRMDEGLIYVTVTNNVPYYEYEYFLKDHLGSTRAGFMIRNSVATISQYTDYYPFGMISNSYNSGSTHNGYRYNGKELQNELGIEWYDYGARFYDPQIARWTVIDNKAEKYIGCTPYAYAINNPIMFIDPNGNEVIATNSASKQLVLQTVSYMFGGNHGFSFVGNTLTHNGEMPSGLSAAQQIVYKYFNEVLVDSHSDAVVKANQNMGVIIRGDQIDIVKVGDDAAATTFSTDKASYEANSSGAILPIEAQNLILVPQSTIEGTTNVKTEGGDRQVDADYVLMHEFGHAIVNIIMNEFGGVFNGVDFRNMTEQERLDWAIRFTNTLQNRLNQETGEGQHERDEGQLPDEKPIPLSE